MYRKQRWQAVMMLMGIACSTRPEQQTVRPNETATPHQPESESYPPGRWRLSYLTTLQNSVIWVSHILIRHRDSSRQAPGTVIPWFPEPAAPERSRADALALAGRIALEASADPSRFAELAHAHSEDVATASQGGALGGVRACDLYFSEPLLDALAQLGSGEVSRVVATDAGFHVLLRQSRPAPTVLSGARIVISYADARSMPEALERSAPVRTRAQALGLANDIYQQAVQHPEAFQELVQRHSEHVDKAEGGDFGTWSRLEPSHLPREVEALAHLSVGEVAPPLDSVYGFEIIQRTAARAPEQPFALELARVRFDPASAASERVAYLRALELLRDFRERPSHFDDYRREGYCCKEPERWYRGRDAGFGRALAEVPVGGMTPQPLKELNMYAIARRIELERLPPLSPTLFELPAPEEPDLRQVSIRNAWETLADDLDDAAAWARENIELTPTEADVLQSFPPASAAEALGPNTRVQLPQFLARVERQLRSDKYLAYRKRLNARFETSLLARGSTVSVEPPPGG
ncbi:MAG: peptidylprolyl isomerase [Deltaproteobacteria bacterium]